MLDVGCWMLDVGCWMLECKCFYLTSNIQHPIVSDVRLFGRRFIRRLRGGWVFGADFFFALIQWQFQLISLFLSFVFIERRYVLLHRAGALGDYKPLVHRPKE